MTAPLAWNRNDRGFSPKKPVKAVRMCDGDLGCQLRTVYFGFHLGLTGSLPGALGKYSEVQIAGGGDAALTLRWANSDSPADGSFEGIGVNLGYTIERTFNDSFRHMPYANIEVWTHDAQITPYLGLAYTLERSPENGNRHGGRLMVGALWRPFTAPMQVDRVNPYLGGSVFIGGEGGDGQGGFLLGLQGTLGLDFFPLF